MNWIFLAVLSALFEGVNAIFLKRALEKIDEYLISFGFLLISSLPIAYLSLSSGIPEIGDKFLSNLIIVCLFDLVGIICTFKALKYSDVSLALPLQTFTPFFLLFTSPIMVGESASLMGYIGVGLIIAGSYFLNLQQSKHGYLAPFKALLSNRSSQLMLFSAALFGITCNMHKIGIVESDSLFYGAIHQFVLAIYFLPIVIYRFSKNKDIKISKETLSTLFILGGFVSLIVICQMLALRSGQVVYVISIKRTSVLISICLSAIILKEGDIKERLTGASVMVSGAIVTAL